MHLVVISSTHCYGTVSAFFFCCALAWNCRHACMPRPPAYRCTVYLLASCQVESWPVASLCLSLCVCVCVADAVLIAKKQQQQQENWRPNKNPHLIWQTNSSLVYSFIFFFLCFVFLFSFLVSHFSFFRFGISDYVRFFYLYRAVRVSVRLCCVFGLLGISDAARTELELPKRSCAHLAASWPWGSVFVAPRPWATRVRRSALKPKEIWLHLKKCWVWAKHRIETKVRLAWISYNLVEEIWNIELKMIRMIY